VKHYDRSLFRLTWEQALHFLRTQGDSFGFEVQNDEKHQMPKMPEEAGNQKMAHVQSVSDLPEETP